ncbi:MAG: sulfide/dihydroorotate dehydrogenase-like FAD/NAD-binding protein [Candidatus Omnitrophica bacterium]|nr:sulfide/dihydroorotate dehydrogenase-like FAD/NAD-binding protein [Candidatus Omnitrophota bacterium]
MFKIIDKYKLASKTHYVLIEAPIISAKAQPGQFVIVRIHQQGERIPLTIADFERNQGTIALVFQEVGKTTQLLASLRKGDYLLDVLGPQGNPTEIALYGKVILVGGGIGVAAVFPIARALKEKGNVVTAIIGYRSKEYVFWEEKMRLVTDQLFITTNDGSYGQKGFVTDILKTLIAEDYKPSVIFAIGPAVMMKAVAELTRPYNIKTIVSLNSLMVCAMGMCGACRVEVGGKTYFTCMDGPDFDGHQVNFDLLIKRLDTYREEECYCCKK